MLGRRKLILVISVLLLLGVAAGATAIFGRKGDQYLATCNSFIDAIATKDYKTGYNLLSNGARKHETQKAWAGRVSILTNVYNKGTVTPGERTETQQTLDAEDNAQAEKTGSQVRLAYTVVNPVATSDVVCITTKEDGKYVVDGFSSQLRQKENQ